MIIFSFSGVCIGFCNYWNSFLRITQRIYKRFPVLTIDEDTFSSPFVALGEKNEINPALEFVKSVCQVSKIVVVTLQKIFEKKVSEQNFYRSYPWIEI